MELSDFLYIIAMALFAFIIAAVIVLAPLAVYTLRHDPTLRFPDAIRLAPKITFRTIRSKFSFKNRKYNAPVGKVSSKRKGNRHKKRR